MRIRCHIAGASWILAMLYLVLAACGRTDGYTKLDEHGQVLPDSAADWVCVRDNASRLVWEVKRRDGRLRDWRNTYTHYDDAGQAQKPDGANPTQAEIEAAGNAAGFRNAVNVVSLCGARDWRLPSREELNTLLSGDAAPFIDTRYFPDIDKENSVFWTSSADPVNPFNAWSVNFGRRNGAYDFRNFELAVRLVRGGK